MSTHKDFYKREDMTFNELYVIAYEYFFNRPNYMIENYEHISNGIRVYYMYMED